MENVHNLSLGDNFSTNTDAELANKTDAASGDIDTHNDKDKNNLPVTCEKDFLQDHSDLDTALQGFDKINKLSIDDPEEKSLSTSICVGESIVEASDNAQDKRKSVDSNNDEHNDIQKELVGPSEQNKKSVETGYIMSDHDTKTEKSLGSDTILIPLVLNEESNKHSSKTVIDDPNKKFTFSPSRQKLLDNETPCVLCDHVEPNMDSASHFNQYLCHLLVVHNIVVADVKFIADFQSYALYWKARFSEKPLDDFCTKIRTNSSSKDIGKSEEYYLLCDALPEDKKIREQLQFNKLKKLLLRQEFERKDENFTGTCPFCNKIFLGNRLILFDHMSKDHSFNIGHPDNIVNVREFLDAIQSKLNKLQCLFCENFFRDRVALREHMRKKGHRQLNPSNKEYDKYYMINYLELGKNWQVMQGESERLDGSSDDWSGWYEEMQKAVCFFCNSSYDKPEKVYSHMKEDHEFDFVLLQQEMQLSFYQQVKLINYVRRQIYLAKRDGSKDIVSMIRNDLKSTTKWNQPQYYFSTYEDDVILCQIEDKEGLFEPEDTFVIGEDGIDCRTIVNNSVLTDLVVGGYFDP